jgi:CheY-like chemotaxis protein
VAKILVADDNSNIQKMVGLALKDQGIDVVSVGNGEAAVRKISDLHPDLVLADVFMPVRNGYEVCEFVKDDESLAHIPVILLVGAFDPLDEQEAQRVRADGVLKKPFVPPDPLISMVKSALTRTGVLEREAAEREAAAAAAAAARAVPPPPKVVPLPEPAPYNDDDAAAEEFSTRPPVLKIEPGGQPAFANMLGSMPSGVEDPDQTVVRSAGTVERDWRSLDDAEAVAEEPEAESAPAWRRDAGEEAFAAADRIPSAPAGWDETPAEPSLSTKHSEPWTPSAEKHAISMEAEEAPKAPWLGAASIRATKTVAEESWSVSAPPPISNDPLRGFELPPAHELHAVSEVETPLRTETPAQTAATSFEQSVPSVAETSPAPTWFSTSTTSPWETEKQRADLLASTWGAPASEPASASHLPTFPKEVFHEEVSREEPGEHAATQQTPTAIEEPPTVPSIDEAFAAVRPLVEVSELPPAELVPERSTEKESVLEESRGVAASLSASDNHPSSPLASLQESVVAAVPQPQESTEDIVAKVMAKMSPEVLQALTREILKPVVESMVREELNSKKQ